MDAEQREATRQSLSAHLREIQKVLLVLEIKLREVPRTMPAIALSIGEVVLEKTDEVNEIAARLRSLEKADIVELEKRSEAVSQELTRLEARAAGLSQRT